MTGMTKGIVLGVIHVGMILTVSGKLLYDRWTRPRAWAQAATYDPDLPIRGRYLSQRLQYPAEGFPYKAPENKNGSDWTWENHQWAYLESRDGKLVGKMVGPGPGQWVYVHRNPDGNFVAFSDEPVLLFIPDTANVPSLKRGEEVWVEVTIPKKGPPRPIRAGIKKNGMITPLEF